MQMISEVMTRNVQYVSPQENLQRAAQLMDELNVGALPVCEGEKLIGMITDRDITVRATAAGMAPGEANVEQAMSTDVRWCFEDQSLDEVMQQMSDTQIRRVPVVSHDDAHKLIGIVSLGDLVTKAADSAQREEVEQVMEKVSSPSEPDRSQTRQESSAATASGGSPSASGEGIGTPGGTGTPGTAGGLGDTGPGPGESAGGRPENAERVMDTAGGARTTLTAGGMDVSGGESGAQDTNNRNSAADAGGNSGSTS